MEYSPARRRRAGLLIFNYTLHFTLCIKVLTKYGYYVTINNGMKKHHPKTWGEGLFARDDDSVLLPPEGWNEEQSRREAEQKWDLRVRYRKVSRILWIALGVVIICYAFLWAYAGLLTWVQSQM
jgi:hypothetical protein